MRGGMFVLTVLILAVGCLITRLTVMAQLIEILLPLKDASGEDFPAAYYDDLAKELVVNFGASPASCAPRRGAVGTIAARPSTTTSLSSR